VVQIFELGEDQGEYFIAMEYIQGPSLHRVRKRLRELGQPFPFDIAAYVVAQALQGLHYAHELRDEAGGPLGIVHRDISPDNVLVSMDGVVKVVDFGIAKAADASSQTQSGTLKGKLSYISPEQVNGRSASPRSDIYATGVMLYQLFTNTLPFRAPSSAALLQQIATVEPEAPRRLELDVPSELNDIVMKALRKDPRERFSSAQEMSRALLEALESHQRRLFPEDLSRFLKQLFEPEASFPRFFVEPNPRLARPAPRPPPEDERTIPLPAVPPRPRARGLAWVGGGVVLAGLVGLVALRPWQRDLPPAAPEPLGAQAPAPSAAKPPVAKPPAAKPPVVEAPPPAPSAPPVAPPRETAPETATGRVYIRVNPWAEVFHGGRRLGITPMPAIQLPAGRQTLTLKNKDLGVSRDYRVSVPANGQVTLKADLLE
jgi:eukaryotic-like serine/threonine-protein kinase